MMYVSHKSIRPKNGETSGYVGWHTGQAAPKVVLKELFGEHYLAGVTEVQADGDELEYIMTHFTNIPHAVRNRSPSWFGEMARFIVHNMT